MAKHTMMCVVTVDSDDGRAETVALNDGRGRLPTPHHRRLLGGPCGLGGLNDAAGVDVVLVEVRHDGRPGAGGSGRD